MTKFDFNSKTRKYDLRNALRLAEASNWAYKSEKYIKTRTKAEWGFDNFRFFSNKKDTQAFIVANDDVVILSFRGTHSIDDWLTNSRMLLVPGPWGKGVHKGFNLALDLRTWKDIEETVLTFQKNKLHPLWITGHSLGGALATLATARFLESERTVKGLYTFGQPRVGGRAFERKFNSIFKPRTFRFVNYHDIVPRVPPRSASYKHIGRTGYIDSTDKINFNKKAWEKFLDLASSKKMKSSKNRKELREAIPDGVRDHDIKEYIRKIRKNLA